MIEVKDMIHDRRIRLHTQKKGENRAPASVIDLLIGCEINLWGRGGVGGGGQKKGPLLDTYQEVELSGLFSCLCLRPFTKKKNNIIVNCFSCIF